MGAATALHTAVAGAGPRRGDAAASSHRPRGRRATRSEYANAADMVEAQGVDGVRRGVELEAGARDPRADQGDLLVHVRRCRLTSSRATLRGASQSDLPPKATVQAITVPTLILAWDHRRRPPARRRPKRSDELLPESELLVAHELADIGPWTDKVITFLDSLS